MDTDTTTLVTSLTNANLFDTYVHTINFIFSSCGILFNLILLIFLILLKRHRCTTYFLLILMTICDFLYCTVYISILLTIDNYLNIINHQILCPLSFFLTPFTFTGSILLLLICLLHLITNYVRKYNTVLGQIGGRLSVVFVFGFIIIRSVLSSTSIELMVDPVRSQVEHCIIDMNTPEIVSKVQNIIHIFGEVTDILVYIGWFVILIMHFISVIRNRNTTNKRNETNFKSCECSTTLVASNNQREAAMSTNRQRLTNKEHHQHVSSIIIWLSIISALLYLPIMVYKLVSACVANFGTTFLNDQVLVLLQIIQQSAHLFCLAIKFIPYFIFDKRIRSSIYQLIGIKIRKRNQTSQNNKIEQKLIFHCQCSRRQQSISSNASPHIQNQTHL